MTVVISVLLESVIIQSLNTVANIVWANRMSIEHVILVPVSSPIDQSTRTNGISFDGANALMALNIKSLIA